MTVNVYKPTYKVAGKDHKGDAHYEVTMKKIGTAKSYEDAKKKYGGYPVVSAAQDGYVDARESVGFMPLGLVGRVVSWPNL